MLKLQVNQSLYLLQQLLVLLDSYSNSTVKDKLVTEATSGFGLCIVHGFWVYILWAAGFTWPESVFYGLGSALVFRLTALLLILVTGMMYPKVLLKPIEDLCDRLEKVQKLG